MTPPSSLSVSSRQPGIHFNLQMSKMKDFIISSPLLYDYVPVGAIPYPFFFFFFAIKCGFVIDITALERKAISVWEEPD